MTAWERRWAALGIFVSVNIGNILIERWFSTWRESMVTPDRYYLADLLVALLFPLAMLSPLLLPLSILAVRAFRRGTGKHDGRVAFGGCLLTLFLLQLFPMRREAEDLHALVDPYSKTKGEFRVCENGTTLLLTGIIGYGTAKAAASLLTQHPGITRLELDSPGGFATEGIWLGNLIRERKLATETRTFCASACAYAYAGGVERRMAANAKIGFHQPILSVPDDDALRRIIRVHKRYLENYGVAPAFADQAFTHPYLTPWFPDKGTLLGAHVVTKIVPEDE